MTDFVGPYPISDVIARLTASTLIKEVGTAADLKTALEQKPSVVPAAYVVIEERGGAVKAVTGVFIQDVAVAIQVVMMVRNYKASATGAGAAAEMEALETEVRSLLVGKRPSGAFHPNSISGARAEIFAAGY
ncbi:MAG: hypothetical protein ABI831_16390, partial [Betaproteobacteria bacterium]